MMSSKSTSEAKIRSKWFKPSEQELLVSLVAPRVTLANDKGRSTDVIKKKEAMWTRIAESYNSNSELQTGKRTADQLSKKWENIQNVTKEKISLVKQSQRQTGGGRGVANFSEFEKVVADTISENISPLTNQFDGDHGHHQDEIHLESEKDDAVELSKTPISSKRSSDNFIFSKQKKRKTSDAVETTVSAKLLALRALEHEEKMAGLRAYRHYWEERYRHEFGSSSDVIEIEQQSQAEPTSAFELLAKGGKNFEDIVLDKDDV